MTVNCLESLEFFWVVLYFNFVITYLNLIRYSLTQLCSWYYALQADSSRLSNFKFTYVCIISIIIIYSSPLIVLVGIGLLQIC